MLTNGAVRTSGGVEQQELLQDPFLRGHRAIALH